MKKSRPELELAKEIAASDGNAFHARVATFFRDNGWTVQISPYYVDNATGQAREIDLICEKMVVYAKGLAKMPGRRGEQLWGAVTIQLWVECKYLKGPVVFWIDDCDAARRDHWLRQHTPFKPSATMSQFQHRYMTLGSQVAKLFRGTDTQDPIYKGLAQTLGALIQRRGKKLLLELAHGQGGRLDSQLVVPYPVIVCSDNAGFYRTHIGDDPGETQLVTSPFLLEVDYAYTKNDQVSDEYFLVDVVKASQLESFVRRLDDEAQEAAALLEE